MTTMSLSTFDYRLPTMDRLWDVFRQEPGVLGVKMARITSVPVVELVEWVHDMTYSHRITSKNSPILRQNLGVMVRIPRKGKPRKTHFKASHGVR